MLTFQKPSVEKLPLMVGNLMFVVLKFDYALQKTTLVSIIQIYIKAVTFTIIIVTKLLRKKINCAVRKGDYFFLVLCIAKVTSPC